MGDSEHGRIDLRRSRGLAEIKRAAEAALSSDGIKTSALGGLETEGGHYGFHHVTALDRRDGLILGRGPL